MDLDFFESLKPGVADKQWCATYARSSVALKKGSLAAKKDQTQALNAIKQAFGTIYRAVAFDIDGTVTKKDSSEIDPTMAQIIGGLLRRSVPVLLITGRGRTSAKLASNEIRRQTGLSDWYMRRLQNITHNGVIFLKTPQTLPEKFLEEEKFLSLEIPNMSKLLDELNNMRVQDFPKNEIHISEEPRSIRIAFRRNNELREKIEQKIEGLISEIYKGKIKIFLCRGSYEDLDCLDISRTNKLKALNMYADIIGVSADRIIRIGDQGQAGGNDYDLLASVNGFSVGEFSNNPKECHPVLDDRLKEPLQGAEATQCLLERIMLFSPLSIEPKPTVIRLSGLGAFEKLALLRSRKETETVQQRLRVRLRYLLSEGDNVLEAQGLDLNEIFDPRCGGIRFREWEFDELEQNHPALRLFGIEKLKTHRLPKQLRWCMFTDIGILMRGPEYFYAMTREENEIDVSTYLRNIDEFINEIPGVVGKLSNEKPNFVLFKLFLAILDNVRNILLSLQYATFISESTNLGNKYFLAKKIYRELLVPHTRIFYRMLLDPDAQWQKILYTYQNLVIECVKIFKKIDSKYKNGSLIKPRSKQLLRRWREGDHFLQNVTAIQLGFHELMNNTYNNNHDKIIALGLTYGGTELPAIAEIVAEARELKIDSGLFEISIYHDRETGNMIRQGEQDYIKNMLLKPRALVIMTEDHCVNISGRKIILLDDNCTTCSTLQLARDILVLRGGDVLGAVTVRFPGVNRHVQMAMPGHGFPDSEIFFGFIRGLIAPSPYARLHKARRGKEPYLDQTGIFDKSRWRIERYLKKNSTPPKVKA